jgi:V8-like Glu-specific endopeptidase
MKKFWITAFFLLIPLILSAESFVSHRVAESLAAVEAYWTPERMANAKPQPLGRVEATLSPGIPMVGANGYDYPPPHTTYIWDSTKALSLYTQFPFKAMGKIFFTLPSGQDSECSGTSIGGRAVLTAGHCISDGNGTYFTNVMFVPAYSKPSKTGTYYKAPFGKWYAEEIWAFEEWHTSKDWCRDVAFIVTKKNAGVTLSQRVGSLGIAVNKSAVQHWNMFGWPADPPYDGRFMVQTQASFSSYSQTSCGGVASPQGMGTIQTGGCSGGPWVLDLDPYERGTTGNVVNSVNSFTSGSADYEIFGPYFDDAVLNAWTEFTKK